MREWEKNVKPEGVENACFASHGTTTRRSGKVRWRSPSRILRSSGEEDLRRQGEYPSLRPPAPFSHQAPGTKSPIPLSRNPACWRNPGAGQIQMTKWASTKSQAPNTKQIPSTKGPRPQTATARLVLLIFGISVLVWHLVLEFWCFPFTPALSSPLQSVCRPTGPPIS